MCIQTDIQVAISFFFNIYILIKVNIQNLHFSSIIDEVVCSERKENLIIIIINLFTSNY